MIMKLLSAGVYVISRFVQTIARSYVNAIEGFSGTVYYLSGYVKIRQCHVAGQKARKKRENDTKYSIKSVLSMQG